MKTAIFSAFVLAACLAGASAHAQPNVSVADPWVRGTVAQQPATGAFMRLTANQNARLVAASSPVAGLTEIHEMVVTNDIMRMRAIPALALPAGQAVELRPGSYHVMLMQLRQQLRAGERVNITLVFEDANGQRFNQTVVAAVREMATPAHGGHGHAPAGHAAPAR